MKLWMAVTNDKYELPCCVVGTARELSSVYGIRESNMLQSIRNGKGYKKFGVRFVKVEVQDD